MTVCKSSVKASKSSPRKMRTAFHVRPRTARDAERTANVIDYVEKQGRPETTKQETRVKGDNT